MKRDILCLKCAKESRNRFVDLPLKENVRHVDGKALAYFNCDLCGCEICQAHPCTARSVWITDDLSNYYNWEVDYITIDND